MPPGLEHSDIPKTIQRYWAADLLATALTSRIRHLDNGQLNSQRPALELCSI